MYCDKHRLGIDCPHRVRCDWPEPRRYTPIRAVEIYRCSSRRLKSLRFLCCGAGLDQVARSRLGLLGERSEEAADGRFGTRALPSCLGPPGGLSEAPLAGMILRSVITYLLPTHRFLSDGGAMLQTDVRSTLRSPKTRQPIFGNRVHQPRIAASASPGMTVS